MPVTPADIDAAVPVGGTPSRLLTNSALKGLIQDIADVGVGLGVGTVNTFADLPAAASHTGERWWVLTSTGVWLVNRRTKGAYYSDGVTWSYLGDFPVTAAEVGNVPAGGIAAGNVQDALNELDTEKANVADVNPLTLTNPPLATPAAGAVSLGIRDFAGLPAFFSTSGAGRVQMFQSLLGNDRMFAYFGPPAATGVTAFPGTPALTAQGTGTARTPAPTNVFTRQSRVGYVSAATAPSLSGVHLNSSGLRNLYIGGNGLGSGFLFIARFGVSDAATVAGARMFFGLSTATGAPTNVDPAGLANQIGIAKLDSSSNLHIVYGGTTAQPAIDLGVNFPADTSSTDWYEFVLFSDKNDNTKVGYRVERLNTGDVASGTLTNTTPGTTLPGTGVVLGPRVWRTNNATALAVAIDIGAIAIHVE